MWLHLRRLRSLLHLPLGGRGWCWWPRCLRLRRRHCPVRLLGSWLRWWHAPLLLLRLSLWHLHRDARNALEMNGLQHHAWRCRQVLSLPLLPVLGQLDQPQSDGEFLVVEARRRWLICDRPDIFQDLNGKLGARKKLDCLSSANVGCSLNVGGTK